MQAVREWCAGSERVVCRQSESGVQSVNIRSCIAHHGGLSANIKLRVAVGRYSKGIHVFVPVHVMKAFVSVKVQLLLFLTEVPGMVNGQRHAWTTLS